MKMEELWKIVSEGGGDSAVLWRLEDNGIDTDDLLCKSDLIDRLHSIINCESWDYAYRVIEELENASDDAVFTIDISCDEIYTLDDPSSLIDWLIENDRVEVEEDEED